MNEKLLQKKGRIVSQLATELLGKGIHERMMPIMYYQKKYQTSQGTIQNAVNFLKEKNAIKLVNKGYQGSFIKEINYDILQEYCQKLNLVGCMTIPCNEKMELLASLVYHQLQDKNTELNMHYMKVESSIWIKLKENTFDFVICSNATAKSWIKKDKDLEIVVDFGYETLSSKPIIVHMNNDIQTLGVIKDDDVLHKIGLQYALEQSLTTKSYTKRSIELALRNKQIQAYIDGEEEVNFLTDYQKASMNEKYLEETRAVIVAKKKQDDVKFLMKSKLVTDEIKSMMEAYKNGNLEIEY